MAVGEEPETDTAKGEGDNRNEAQWGQGCERVDPRPEPGTARLGQLFPYGKRGHQIQQRGSVCREAIARLPDTPRWKEHETGTSEGLDRTLVPESWLASVGWDDSISGSGARYTMKTIVKPCAGKPQARFEREVQKTGTSFVRGV